MSSTATPSATTTSTATQTSVQEKATTGIIIPLYTNYSTSKWGLVIHAKTSNPGVPVVGIVNPHIGPGDHYNSSYAISIKEMQKAGIIVIGYVWTDYGAKNLTVLRAQILAYSTWYGVDGVLLDGMANQLRGSSGAYMPAYYSNLTAYAKSIGMTKVFGNPGADTLPPFIGTVDTMGIFENGFLPSLQFLGGWHAGYNKTNFAFISHNVSSLSSVNSSYILGASDYVGYLFFSNMTRSHYPTLPPYLDQLVATLASMTTITIRSVSQSASPVAGPLLASVTQPDGSSVRQPTPFVFQAYVGSTVQVSVQDYKGNAFDHWGDGSAARTVAILVQGPLVLDAYLRQGP